MMEPTWDLSVFYKGFDDPALREDIRQIQQWAVKAGQLEGEDVTATLEGALRAMETLENLLSRAFGFAQLTAEADNTNDEALRLISELDNIMVEVSLAHSRIVRYVGQVEDLEARIAQSDFLQGYAFILREM